MDCKHDKIKVVRFGRGYVWTCALCNEYIMKEHLAQGEGFVFNIVERGSDAKQFQA